MDRTDRLTNRNRIREINARNARVRKAIKRYYPSVIQDTKQEREAELKYVAKHLIVRPEEKPKWKRSRLLYGPDGDGYYQFGNPDAWLLIRYRRQHMGYYNPSLHGLLEGRASSIFDCVTDKEYLKFRISMKKYLDPLHRYVTEGWTFVRCFLYRQTIQVFHYAPPVILKHVEPVDPSKEEAWKPIQLQLPLKQLHKLPSKAGSTAIQFRLKDEDQPPQPSSV